MSATVSNDPISAEVKAFVQQQSTYDYVGYLGYLILILNRDASLVSEEVYHVIFSQLHGQPLTTAVSSS